MNLYYSFTCSIFYIVFRVHVFCPPPIDHVMTRPQGAAVADSFQIWSATATALSKQFRQPTKSYPLTLILRRSRTGTVWFYTSTSNKRAAPPKLYTKSLTRDLKRMYSRLTLVRISINLQAPCVLYIRTGVSLLSRERFLYI